MTRRLLIIFFLITALGYVNYLALATESSIKDGRTILLELRPADPRSLIQGDYMRLAYAIENDFSERIDEDDGAIDGKFLLVLDNNSVGTFAGLLSAENVNNLPPDQIVIKYHGTSRWDITFAPDSYFFQEGSAEIFDEARYAELRVTADGRTFLIGLRDEQFKLLGE